MSPLWHPCCLPVTQPLTPSALKIAFSFGALNRPHHLQRLHQRWWGKHATIGLHLPGSREAGLLPAHTSKSGFAGQKGWGMIVGACE